MRTSDFSFFQRTDNLANIVRQCANGRVPVSCLPILYHRNLNKERVCHFFETAWLCDSRAGPEGYDSSFYQKSDELFIQIFISIFVEYVEFFEIETKRLTEMRNHTILT